MTPNPERRPLRIAFVNMEGAQWTAGAHYLKNLFAALQTLDSDQRPEIALVSDKAESNGSSGLRSYVDRWLVMPSPPPWPNFWQRQRTRFEKRLGIWHEPESPLGPYLRRQQVDVAFSGSDYGPKFGVPLLAWIPDFQHRHLPEMFSAGEIEDRDRLYSRIVTNASRVIVSSQSARQDLIEFALEAGHKTRVLSFVSHVPPEVYTSDPGWVCDAYHLPRRFFYLPNQFWKHKNHGVVVKALALLKSQYPDLNVVCTGNTNEYRAPLYFAELLAEISRAGLRDRVIILGLVPHDRLFALMRQSLAVLQPSLFEGWSTTVEEVKSLGKALILSDIPVHREQDPPRAIYFDPGCPELLADCLVKANKEYQPGPDQELESAARAQLPRRMRQFAQVFVGIAKEVVA